MNITDEYGQDISVQEAYNRMVSRTEQLSDENNDLKRRVEQLERTGHQLYRMFYPQIQFQQAIDRLESMLDREEYVEVDEQLRALRSLIGENVALVGVQAQLDMQTFLGQDKANTKMDTLTGIVVDHLEYVDEDITNGDELQQYVYDMDLHGEIISVVGTLNFDKINWQLVYDILKAKDAANED